MADIGNVIQLENQQRIYHYVRNGIEVTAEIKDIAELVVRDSGAHRLKDKDGKLYYMAGDYFYIEIIKLSKEWTV